MKLKVGLIGAGGFGYLHLSGYEKNTDCEIISVASRTEASAQKAAKKFGIPHVYWGEDWRKMLIENEMDVVSICSPNYLHAEMAIEALKNGCNVLCEKPIAISHEELNKIQAELLRNNLIYFSSFNKRYIPFVSKIKEMLQSDLLGEINMVRSYFSHYGPYTSWRPLSEQKWFFDEEKAGGGVLIDLGVHSIDLLRFLIGEYDKVEAYSQNTTCKKITREDNCNVLFRFRNNALGIITVSWCNEPMEIIEIFGNKGMISINMQSSEPLTFKPKKLKKNQLIEDFLITDYTTNVMTQHLLIDHFVDCILQGKQGHPNFTDGKRALEFVLDAYSKLDMN